MHKIIIIVLLLAVGGCAAPAVYNFSRGELKAQEFGVVKGSYNLMDEWVGVSIAGFVKAGGDDEFNGLRSVIFGYPRTINLTPGEYQITIRCEGYYSYAVPQIKLKVEEGMVYEVKCKDVGEDKALAYINKQYSISENI